jgi:Tannase and feruloyl esterase
VTCAVVAVLAVAAPASAAGPAGPGDGHPDQGRSGSGLADLRAVPPVMDCAAVAQLDLSGVTDGEVTITSATPVDPGTPAGDAGRSRFTVKASACDVKGVIGPGANRFEILLPTTGWTQRYLQVGCGGLCGAIGLNPPQAADCQPVADGTIAMAATDMGHEGRNDGSWALDNQAILDFAYRSQHVTAQVAKAVIGEFYGQAPKYSYFSGCSDGGREALMEAQRYPDDFDGIAAGAPANDLVVQNTFHHAWNILANQDEDGRFILLSDKLSLIHEAVLATCDSLDGVEDGVLDDPRRCDFDPAALLCPPEGTDTSACLTPAEVDVVRKLHEGPVDAAGRNLQQPIAHEWGSELGWSLFVPPVAEGTPPPPAGPATSIDFVTSFLRYLAFQNGQDPDYQLSDLEFTVPNFWEVVQSSKYLAATDPDLTEFARSRGKLILWHGWEDQHITPQSTLDYYDSMQEVMGDEWVDRFTRLYMFPGLAHCSGGNGANVFDILTPLMAWTETRTAPGKIVTSQVAEDGEVTRTRPVYPYPAVARYDGSGSTDKAANFYADTPDTEPSVGHEWVGEPLYSSGYQTTCHVDEQGRLVCDPAARSLPGADG